MTRVIVGHRSSGKTTELIRMAHDTDQYIIEPTRRQAVAVFRMARDMGLPIRMPVTPHELQRTPLERTLYGRYHPGGGVLVDDLQEVLEQLGMRSRVDAVAVTSDGPPLVLYPGENLGARGAGQ